MKTLLLSVALVFLPTLSFAGESVRKGTPEDCYLFVWGTGAPDGLAKLEIEFTLEQLKAKQPYLSAASLAWGDKSSEPTITEVIRCHGKRVVRIEYPRKDGKFGATISLVMLAMETGLESGWFKPFLVVEPELFTGYPMVSKAGRAGYLAVLEYSGSGGFATYLLFDFARPFPKLVTKVSTGRAGKNDYPDEEKLRKALERNEMGERLRNGEWVEGIVNTDQQQ